MRTLIFYRASILSLFIILAQPASAAVFEVATAKEFQAGVNAAVERFFDR